MPRQGVGSMFAMSLLLGVFASIPQSDYLSISLSLSLARVHPSFFLFIYALLRSYIGEDVLPERKHRIN
jgi:hypothetical protein